MQRAVSVSEDEVKQLKGTVNSLREELERNDIEHQEAMQRATSLAQDENRQLKGTVNSLREELEKTRME